ncbi:MAG TPA: hypothetical protein VGR21_07875 [Cryptosporangiaceae bacterium]|nr:hypothetical protein [Cryptosporangiaceae bacterium]
MTSARVARAVVVVATAALVGFGGSACGLFGATVDKSTVSTKLQEELNTKPEGKDLSGDQQKKFSDCAADALLKYGNKDDLQKFVDGDLESADIRGMDTKDAETATQLCALEASVK